MSLEGFEPLVRPAFPWPVHRGGEGPPVIVMHELFGLTEPVLAFARNLVAEHFTVYLPVLAGPAPSRTKWDGRRAAARICVSREIDVIRWGRTNKIVTPLRRLAEYASEQADGADVGVVGMCFSGGFAMALAAFPPVAAGVAAQPSLPFTTRFTPWCATKLGMSSQHEEDLAARLASDDAGLYVTRFSDDRTSPVARQHAIEQRLGVPVHVLDSAGFKPGAHSVLAKAVADHEDDPAAAKRLRRSFDDVVAFLRGRLGPAGTGTPDDEPGIP